MPERALGHPIPFQHAFTRTGPMTRPRTDDRTVPDAEPSRPPVRLTSGGGFVVFLALLFLLATPAAPAAEEKTWIQRNGESFVAQLASFDFEEKTARFNGYDGRVFDRVANDLNFRAKCRLFASSAFHASFPAEWSPAKTHFTLVVIALPSAFSLAAFWLSGLLLAGRWNPVRAVLGWIGAILLGAFFTMFYLYVASLSKESSVAFFGFGGVVSLIAMALYVSVIFRTSTFKGALIFGFHFFAAAALFFAASLVFERGIDPVTQNQWADDYIFQPVGLLR